jgi:phosphatidylserine/phosphatidylglycerophosphate/cardiolipin synthase-like enzyme
MEFLEPHRTCWRIEAASRTAFLIDYQSYYQALVAILGEARRQIWLLGWSFDPRTRLMPDGEAIKDAPDRIGQVLIDLAAARPDLDIRVLIWRSDLAISVTQDFFPHRANSWFKGTGVNFRLDHTIPFGACHHQKVVVVDDRLAICGSGDICGDRWDTSAHADEDARRRTPDGGFHPPRHEVMMMAQGPIALALGDLARGRWRESGGEDVAPSGPSDAIWPAEIAADIDDARLAIARTEPKWKSRKGCAEILALTLAAIAGARRSIYIENQYFTAPIIAEALAARLAEPDGPEIVLVSTHKSASYFDRLTMDRTRTIFVHRLMLADVFGRLRIFAPFSPGGEAIIVHAKDMVVDDALAVISSANLNNRSQGFDTECELALEAKRDEERAAIGSLRDGLIGHWLGRTAAQFATVRQRRGGLIAAITELNRNDRLRPIEPRRLGPIGAFIADFHIGDPISVTDSWSPLRRRERLYREAREREAARKRA